MDNTGVIYAKDQGNNNVIAAYNTNAANNWFITQ